MTEVLGTKLGKVITIDEHQPSMPYQSFASNTAFIDPRSAPVDDVIEGTFAPGAIEVRISVHVTFAIE